jgi:hypothetical protein
VDLGTVSWETFSGHVGSGFTLGPAGEGSEGVTLPVQLTSADAVGDAPPGGGRAPFSLMFSGPAEPIVRQGIYRLSHPELGTLDLFLVPLAPDGDGARYQAVFT